VQRASCEFNDMVDRVFDDRGIDCETLIAATARLVLAMIASGFGFGFFPKYSISNAAVWPVVVNPEFWRESAHHVKAGPIHERSARSCTSPCDRLGSTRQRWPSEPRLPTRPSPTRRNNAAFYA